MISIKIVKAFKYTTSQYVGINIIVYIINDFIGKIHMHII